jgi:hypothetical protein
MREFFYHLLQNLDKLAGLKQFEKLLQTQDAKQEINNLLDILCRVSDQFPYIPEEDKKRIIQDATIADQEFMGLNAKIIYKWLNAKRDLYIREAKDEVVIHPEALTGEAMQKRLDEWKQSVAKLETTATTRVDIYQTVREQWKPKEGTDLYKPTDPGLVFNHQRHLQYLKENYDPKTGKELPNWISEDEWNILNP